MSTATGEETSGAWTARSPHGDAKGPVLNLVLYLDGRPGHEKQSRGIAMALQRYVAVRITEKTVAHKRLLQEIVAHLAYLSRVNRPDCRGEKADLVLGSGSRTHLAVLQCKRGCGARALTCMTPAWPLRRFFDLCFIPLHDRPRPGGNRFTTIGPPGLSNADGVHDEHRFLILVGGVDPGSHDWNEAQLISRIRELATREKAGSWTVGSSPRTPATTEVMLGSLAAEFDHVSFYPFADTGPGWVEQQYRVNGTVWVTGDSISMVYEALSAGCKVGILPVDWKVPGNKFHFSERYLIEHNRVVSFASWQSGTACWQAQAPLDEADRCAREILRRWWPKCLP